MATDEFQVALGAITDAAKAEQAEVAAANKPKTEELPVKEDEQVQHDVTTQTNIDMIIDIMLNITKHIDDYNYFLLLIWILT